jgi:hypothetical protein
MVDLDQLAADVELLKQRRLTQVDYTPGSIKNRSMGEANTWINGGLSANRPTTPPKAAQGLAAYFESDTNKLYIWNGTIWEWVQLHT